MQARLSRISGERVVECDFDYSGPYRSGQNDLCEVCLSRVRPEKYAFLVFEEGNFVASELRCEDCLAKLSTCRSFRISGRVLGG